MITTGIKSLRLGARIRWRTAARLECRRSLRFLSQQSSQQEDEKKESAISRFASQRVALEAVGSTADWNRYATRNAIPNTINLGQGFCDYVPTNVSTLLQVASSFWWLGSPVVLNEIHHLC